MARIATVFRGIAIASALASCAPHAPRIGHATRVESFCGSKEARMTGVDSVMTSTNDTMLADRPTERDVRNAVRGGEGVVAYFNDQPLAIAKTAAALGETDGYVRVKAIAIAVAPEGALARHIYLRVRDRGTARWIVMNAYDVQNVCVEGKRKN
ncbi:MAG: hypothetical protein NVS2B8_11530 [Vulcanimicrobiaceae bacterium]